MFVPGLMQRVRLAGINEVYVVTRLDLAGRVADLLPLRYGVETVRAVPFLALEEIPGNGPPLSNLPVRNEN